MSRFVGECKVKHHAFDTGDTTICFRDFPSICDEKMCCAVEISFLVLRTTAGMEH